MSVPFPAKFLPTRQINIEIDLGADFIDMSDGSLAGQVTSTEEWQEIPAIVQGLTSAEADEFNAFLFANRIELIDWDLDGIIYQGHVLSRPKPRRALEGLSYAVSFVFRGRVVGSAILITSPPISIATGVNGAPAVFAVGATAGSGDIEYQWEMLVNNAWTAITSAEFAGTDSNELTLLVATDEWVGVSFRCALSQGENTTYTNVVSILSLSRYTLSWDGVDGYAQMPTPWQMTGFGDCVKGIHTPHTPGVGTQVLLCNADSSVRLYIADVTAELIFDYVDQDGATPRSVNAGAVSANVELAWRLDFAPTGVTLTVNGTEHSNSNRAEPIDIAQFSTDHTLTDFYDGAGKNLEFINETPLQNMSVVQADGTLSASLPQLPLSGSLIFFEYVHAAGDQTVLGGSAPILTVVSDAFVLGSGIVQLVVDGETYAAETLVPGQHYSIVIGADGGTLDTVGPLASGGIVGPELGLTSSGQIYVFNLQGANSSIANSQQATNRLRYFTNIQPYSSDLTV